MRSIILAAAFFATLSTVGFLPAQAQTPSVQFCYLSQVPTITTAAMWAVRGSEFPTRYNAINWSIKLLGQNGNVIVRDAVEAALANASDCDVLLGPGSSVYSTTLSQVTTLPWMDFGSTSTTLSQKWAHPWFSRIIPTDAVGAEGIAAVFKQYSWNKAHIICTDESYGQSLATALESRFRANGWEYERSCVSSGATATELTDVALKIQNSDMRIVVVVMAGWSDAFVNFVDISARTYKLNETRTFVYSESICSGTASLALIEDNFVGGICVAPGYDFDVMKDFHGRLIAANVSYDYIPEFSDVGFNYDGKLTAVADMTYGGFTYDAYNIDAVQHVMGVLDAAQRAGTFNKTDKENTRSLLRSGNVTGMSGYTILDSSGDRIEVQFYFTTIRSDSLVRFATWSGESKEALAMVAGVDPWNGGSAPVATIASTQAPGSDDDDAKARDRNLIIVFAILGGLLFVALLLFLLFRVLNDPTRNAPTDASKPFCVIVTDIEKSTSLWNQYQETMKKTIEIHNRVIRAEIEKHGAYEVMTQGDSFTIATPDVQTAISVSEGIQMALYHARWHAPELDEFYKELDQRRECANYTRGYDNTWNGIRVRVAVAYGTGSILKTESGFQYGGAVMQSTKPLSGHAFGGQILLTNAVYSAMHESRQSRCRALMGDDGTPLTIEGPDRTYELYELRLPEVSRQFPKAAIGPSPTNGSVSSANPFAQRVPSADPSHASADTPIRQHSETACSEPETVADGDMSSPLEKGKGGGNGETTDIISPSASQQSDSVKVASIRNEDLH